MKTLNGLFAAALGLCALAFAMPAEAQQYQSYNGPTALFVGQTNNITANALSNYTQRIDVPRAEYVGLEAGFNINTAGQSNNVVIQFYKSIDGVTNSLLPDFTWTIQANGTFRTTAVTNFTVGPVPYLFFSVTNQNAQSLTNLQLRYGFKR